MKLSNKLLLLLAIFGLLGVWSCQEWDQMDPATGNQVYPKIVERGSYEFGKAFPEEATLGSFEGGETPSIVIDDSLGYVTQLTGGYVKFDNPLLDAGLQKGFSVTMWVKVTESNPADAAIFSFSNELDTTLFFAPDGSLTYNASKTSTSDLMLDDEWKYLAVLVDTGGYTVYVNGVEKYAERAGDIDYADMVDSIPTLPYFYLGYGSDSASDTMWVDNISVYRNLIADNKIQAPEVENDALNAVPTPVYSIDFEQGYINGESVEGTGNIVSDVSENSDAFGKVFHNVGALGTQGFRTNYLKLPSDIFARVTEQDSKAMTISFWVNVGTATNYFYSPIFSAYTAPPVDGENTWPLLVLQTRGWGQVNVNGGYFDFTNELNDEGVNIESTDWIDDAEWHFYASVWTETSVTTYIDGVVQNSWTVDGAAGGQVVTGPMTGGGDLSYICLGGNQAWGWADQDAAFKFDDVAIYSKALNLEHIETIMSDKFASSTSTNE